MTLALAVSLSFSAAYAQKPGYRHNKQECDKHGNRNDRYGNRNSGYSDYKRYDSRELARQKWELQKMIDRARRNDGYISRSERKRIEREWREMNRNVARNDNHRRDRY